MIIDATICYLESYKSKNNNTAVMFVVKLQQEIL